MKLSEIKFEKEDGLSTSQPIFIPLINAEVEMWVDTEGFDFPAWSEKQQLAFLELMEIQKNEWVHMQNALQQLYAESNEMKRVQLASLDEESSAFELSYRAFILPKQELSGDRFVFILADTKWKLTDSEFVLELEILFRNGKFELLQEYSGLWTRLEWPNFYNCKTED